MARIFLDPYAATATPISDSISKLGMALLANRKSPEELEYLRTRTEGSNLENEKVRREFNSRDEVASYAGEQNFDPVKNAAARAAWIRGGKIGELGDLLRVLAYTQNGAPQTTRDSAFMGAGGAAASTETGHQKTLANALAQTGMQVAGANARNEADIKARRELEIMKDDRTLMPVTDETGALVMRPKSQVGAPGFIGTPVLPSNVFTPSAQPDGTFILKPNQPGMPVAGPHDKQQPFNVRRPDGSVVMSRDGVSDLQGQPIPAGSQKFGVTMPETVGGGEQGRLRDADTAYSGASDVLQRLIDMATKNPTNFGAVGTARSTVQDLIQQGVAGASWLGMNVASVKEQAARIDPALAAQFDESLPATELLLNVAAYQFAKAMDPNGRLSNQDFERARQSLQAGRTLGNAPGVIAAAKELQSIIAASQGRVRERLGGQPAPGGNAAPAAPGPTPGAPRRIRLGADGSVIE